MRVISGNVLLVFSCLLCATAQGQTYPRLTGAMSRPECGAAMHMAQAAFDSTNARLDAPLRIPDEFGYKLILGNAKQVDISGGHALESDRNRFTLSQDVTRSDIYWGRDTSRGERIVEIALPMGWQGHMYSLYILDAKISEAAFLKDKEANTAKHVYEPVIDEVWRPPLVFWNQADRTEWFLDVALANSEGSWSVYIPDSSHPEPTPVCTVEFWPWPESDSSMFGLTHVVSRLPNAVSRLAELLDQSIGSGRDEGTLQPTAALRIRIKRVWNNLADRPWALSYDDGHQSRDAVDNFLSAWSSEAPSFAKIYRQIQQTYPSAQLALSSYYRRKFGLPKAKADSFAKWALDVAYRSNYDFPSEGNADVLSPPNPWGNTRSHGNAASK